MKVAVLGYGSQGVSSIEYWLKRGAEITLCDRNEDVHPPDDVALQVGSTYLNGLDGFDLIVRSPSIHPRDIVSANPDDGDILNRVTSNTNEFMQVCPSRNIIGVTGTKGKGTTSSLITRILEFAGHKVHLGGNIGTPPLDMLKDGIKPEDWVVLELANFQLIDMQQSPHIGVCVLVAQEHLDWHTNVNEYIESKQQLFRWQHANDIAVYYADNALSQQIASTSKGTRIPYFQTPGARVENGIIIIEDTVICPVSDIKLLGEHNWQNVCAAVTAVWQVTKDVDAIRSAIKDFSGLPFRIEKRTTINDVTFYNDSFATNPSATEAAVKAITAPKVMIIGGYERGLDLSGLISLITESKHQIRHVVVIGESGDRVAKELTAKGATNFELVAARDMQTVVDTAYRAARPGDAVVLSPAFASFGMFKNFEDRGRQFNECIERL